MPLPNNLVFVDTETTGGSTYRDRVIEIGIVRAVVSWIEHRRQVLVESRGHRAVL